jgi:hypothetical protein
LNEVEASMAKFQGWFYFGELPPRVRSNYNYQLGKIKRPGLTTTDRVWLEYDTILRDGQIELRDKGFGSLILTLSGFIGAGSDNHSQEWKALEYIVKEKFGLSTGKAPPKQGKVKYYRGAIPVTVVRQGAKNSNVEWEDDGATKTAKVPNVLLKDHQELDLIKKSQPPGPVRRPPNESPPKLDTD